MVSPFLTLLIVSCDANFEMSVYCMPCFCATTGNASSVLMTAMSQSLSSLPSLSNRDSLNAFTFAGGTL